MIRITAKMNGFRRAGIVHAGTREYPDGFFSPEQLEALKKEPMLLVEEWEDESGNGHPSAEESPCQVECDPEADGSEAERDGNDAGPQTPVARKKGKGK